MRKGKKNDVKKLKETVEDLNNKWKRALADYQNLEKRVLREKEELAKFASENIILKLLPVLDILEKAASHLKDKGLALALEQFLSVLRQEGLEKIEIKNKKFDPKLMECVEVIQGSVEDKVAEELRSGYKLKGKVIRAAQIRAGKKKVEEEKEELTKKS